MRARFGSAMGVLMLVALVLMLVVACGDDDDLADETAESTGITAAAGDEAGEPHQLSDDLLTAIRDGDNETWRGLYAADAVTVFSDGMTLATFGDAPFVVDDFDGDGVTSFADDTQARNALHEPAGQTMTWECSTIGEGRSECTVTASDVFVEAGGGPPLVTRSRWTFDDGKVVKEEFVGPVDPAAMDASGEAHFATLTSYERWVSDSYPDRYEATFHGPCCEGSMIMLPESIAEHEDLMPEYFATR